MFTRILRPFIACVVICALPGALTASETGLATASIVGTATVNGTASQSKQSIHDGDLLKTDRQSKMMISAPSASLGLIEKTDATYSSDSVNVAGGVVTVTTEKGYGAHYNNLSVRPAANQKAQYVVGELNGVSTVAALHGSVIVSDGTHSMILPEGRALQQESQPGVGSGNDKKKNAQRGEGSTGGANRAGTGLSGWVLIAIVGAAIAGTIGGLYAAGVIFAPSTSPSAP